MKKILTLIFLSVFCLNAINAEVTWELSVDGTLTISGTGDIKTMPWNSQRKEIKKIIIENGVTSIGDNAFTSCYHLTSVTIPNSVTSIGSSAFQNCSILTFLSIGNSVTSIEKGAFKGCSDLKSVNITNLKSWCEISFEDRYANPLGYAKHLYLNEKEVEELVIPNGITEIGDYAFWGCEALTSIFIPNSVTSIGRGAFDDCSGLTSVTIPNSVTSIGDWAFAFCSGLTSVTISNSVTSIGDNAFNRCLGLSSINIPNSVTSIGESAFIGCTSLKSVHITDLKSWCEISFGVLDANPLIYANHLYLNGKEVENLVIPNGITEIRGSAFSGCKGLTSVTIPNSVTTIGEGAFYKCSSLTSITIPNSVTSIEGGAFEDCSALISVTIPNSVTSIGVGAFAGCKGLTSITIPNSVTSIGKGTFHYCIGLTSINIPNSVTSIGNGAFSGCCSLTSITIPNSVTNIGECAFESCEGLTSIIIPNSVTSIGSSAFSGCKGLISITIPNSVTAIESYAFKNCSALTNITIPNSVTSIGKETFKFCSGLTSITCEATIPPNCDKNCFDNIDKSIPVCVPVGCVEKYKAANRWKFFTNIIDNQSIADAVIAKINAIGNVEYTDVCKGMIDDASTAYDALTDTQKALITNLDVLTTAKQTYDNLKAAADKTAANPVIAKINAIGEVEYTEVCKGKIDDASTAYDALTDDQKALVTNLDVLTTARQTYETLKAAAEKLAADKSKANDVIAKINAIGNVEYTDACKGKIDDASTAYEALTSDQKALITNLDVLTTAKQTYDALKAVAEKLAVDKAEADAVVAKIAAIGKVKYTDACKKKIDNASKAYDALTDDQKALVTNLDVLTTARQTYDDLKAASEKLAADKAAADAIIAKITAIGNVEYTDVCKGKIDAASTAYNALTADQKALVTNLDVLNKAQQTYETLKAAAEKLAADNAKADAVIAKITAIGKVEYTDACKGKIDAANKAYNALTADQKALVTNLNVLNKAQQTYKTLKAAAEKLIADKAAFDKYKSEIVAIIEALVKDDDSDAVKEIIRKAISDIESLEYEEAISIDDNKAKVQSLVTSVNEAVENQRAEDQKTNGIEELEFADKYNIYDLNGRKITNSMLKSGLYIRNGKKIVIK